MCDFQDLAKYGRKRVHEGDDSEELPSKLRVEEWISNARDPSTNKSRKRVHEGDDSEDIPSKLRVEEWISNARDPSKNKSRKRVHEGDDSEELPSKLRVEEWISNARNPSKNKSKKSVNGEDSDESESVSISRDSTETRLNNAVLYNSRFANNRCVSTRSKRMVDKIVAQPVPTRVALNGKDLTYEGNGKQDMTFEVYVPLLQYPIHTVQGNGQGKVEMDLTFVKDVPKQVVRNSTFNADSSHKVLEIVDVSSIRNESNAIAFSECANSKSTFDLSEGLKNNSDPAVFPMEPKVKVLQNILLSENQNMNETVTKHASSFYEEIEEIGEETSKAITDETYLPSTSVQLENSSDRDPSSMDNPKNSLHNPYFGRDNRQMSIASSKQGTLKKYGCFYCDKRINKIIRHYETVHRSETDVQKIIGLKKGSIERFAKINELREKGNFRHNTDPNIKNNELITKRRLQDKSKKTAVDFIACSKCLATYPKTNIRHHKCLKGKVKNGNPNYVLNGKLLERRMHVVANKTLEEMIFPYFNADHIVDIIKFDELIVSFGNKLCDKYLRPHQHDMIRAKLRYLGKLLHEVRKLSNDVTDFTSIYKPAIYTNVVNAINSIAQFDRVRRRYKSPFVATMYGTLLKQVGEHLISKCIIEENQEAQTRAENFLKLLYENYGVSVNKVVAEQKADDKRHKPIELPSKDDISKLYVYVNKLRRDSYLELTKGFSLKMWTSLSKSTLICLQIFNRRRAGDTEMIKIEDFKNYYQIDVNNQLFSDLSADGKKLASNNVRFVARGKKNRDAKFICNFEVVKCIKLIIQYREEANVPSSNPYIFGVYSKDSRDKYLRACTIMREFASQCGASSWKVLRGTKLRKHIATECISLNLNDNEAQGLADYMGHDKHIHDKYYRLSLPPREILQIGKILTNLQGANNAEESFNNDEDFEVEHSEAEDAEEEVETTVTEDVRHEGVRHEDRKHNGGDIGSVNVSSRSNTTRKRWTSEEVQIITQAFGDQLTKKIYPSSREIELVIQQNKVLSHRKVAHVKSWMQHFLKRN